MNECKGAGKVAVNARTATRRRINKTNTESTPRLGPARRRVPSCIAQWHPRCGRPRSRCFSLSLFRACACVAPILFIEKRREGERHTLATSPPSFACFLASLVYRRETKKSGLNPSRAGGLARTLALAAPRTLLARWGHLVDYPSTKSRVLAWPMSAGTLPPTHQHSVVRGRAGSNVARSRETGRFIQGALAAKCAAKQLIEDATSSACAPRLRASAYHPSPLPLFSPAPQRELPPFPSASAHQPAEIGAFVFVN